MTLEHGSYEPRELSAIHDLSRLLERMLWRDFSTEVHRKHMPAFDAFYLTSQVEGVANRLVLHDQVTRDESLYLYTHIASHIILGHTHHSASPIIERSRALDGNFFPPGNKQILEHDQALALTASLSSQMTQDSWMQLAATLRGALGPQSAHELRRAEVLNTLLTDPRHAQANRILQRKITERRP
jgi:hypothetical protein